MTAAPLLLFGQLLGIAFAAGLNLYATVALLGLASRLGWITWLPPALRGLENEVLIASAAVLFFVEFVVDKVPHVDSLWDAIHTFIRPTAAALLALAALAGQPASVQIAGAVLAGGVTLAAHGTKAGLRLAINAGANPIANSAISIAEDIAAVALVVAALRFPSSALAIAGGSLAITAIVGPGLWRALVFGFRALDARVRGFFEQTRWRSRDELPRGLRELVEPPSPGRAEPRAARASLKGGPRRVGAYRNGWLVITADGPVFLYRSLLGPRKLAIPPIRSLRTRRGPWAEVIELDTERFRCTLFVLGDAPHAEPTLTPFLVTNP